jgi:hypothetical protein
MNCHILKKDLFLLALPPHAFVITPLRASSPFLHLVPLKTAHFVRSTNLRAHYLKF